MWRTFVLYQVMTDDKNISSGVFQSKKFLIVLTTILFHFHAVSQLLKKKAPYANQQNCNNTQSLKRLYQ